MKNLFRMTAISLIFCGCAEVGSSTSSGQLRLRDDGITERKPTLDEFISVTGAEADVGVYEMTLQPGKNYFAFLFIKSLDRKTGERTVASERTMRVYKCTEKSEIVISFPIRSEQGGKLNTKWSGGSGGMGIDPEVATRYIADTTLRTGLSYCFEDRIRNALPELPGVVKRFTVKHCAYGNQNHNISDHRKSVEFHREYALEICILDAGNDVGFSMEPAEKKRLQKLIEAEWRKSTPLDFPG